MTQMINIQIQETILTFSQKFDQCESLQKTSGLLASLKFPNMYKDKLVNKSLPLAFLASVDVDS